jgi:hypothetical protein
LVPLNELGVRLPLVTLSRVDASARARAFAKLAHSEPS